MLVHVSFILCHSFSRFLSVMVHRYMGLAKKKPFSASFFLSFSFFLVFCYAQHYDNFLFSINVCICVYVCDTAKCIWNRLMILPGYSKTHRHRECANRKKNNLITYVDLRRYFFSVIDLADVEEMRMASIFSSPSRKSQYVELIFIYFC